jgi:hypothetical protein
MKYPNSVNASSLCAIMTNLQTIQVIDSWETTAFGVIAELHHDFDGLKTGTIIKSAKTDKEWRVKKRILFYHTFDRQKKFPNELTTYIHASFDSPEKQVISFKNILDKEEQNVFQYQLQPIVHNSKPDVGDILASVVIQSFACPCCGYKTFDHEPNGSYDICSVCFWEDDPIQLEDPDYEGGANPMSLRQAQQNFLEFGACDREMLRNVRPPAKDEERDENWRPLANK